MEYIDLSTITACGECCVGCRKKEVGICGGCIETDGNCQEWLQSNGCPIYKCTKQHNVQFCGLCESFPCEWLIKKITWNPKVVEHLSSLASLYHKQKGGSIMKYRQLGKTGLFVSEIGLGAEWLERQNAAEIKTVIERSEAYGINILDCWMSEPKVRSNVGAAIAGRREKWVIQGHIGSTWQDGRYVRTRELEKVKEAFEDLLYRLQTDYIDLGMIHFVDEAAEFDKIMNGDFIEYVRALKQKGTIRHIGLSTHNPVVAKLAALSGVIEMVLFSLNPAFDMLPASEDINTLFSDHYNEELKGIAPEREELYRICERENVGITVMKGYAGGRLFSAEHSPFGVALTPVQCLHYALTRPAVAAVMVGCRTPEEVDAAVAYENATEEQKDYATVLANAPYHAYSGQCTYCGHCAPCPSYIDIAMVNKLYDLAILQDIIPATVQAHYTSLSANASDCIGCAACEERCPFGVPVVERMKKVARLFLS